MAQTLGSDVPFVMLTASEVFSLEVSWPSCWILGCKADILVDVQDGELDSGL